MIKTESYGYNTYAGLRIAEIQKKTDVDQWKHIPSGENIADILTKGTNPDKLGPKSAWQCGPDWLVKSESEWPVTSHVLTNEEHETIENYQNAGTKKAQAFVATAVKYEEDLVLDKLITKLSDLKKLIRITAYVLRLMGRKQPPKVGERDKVQTVVSASEYHEAWMFLICWEQKQRLDAKKHTNMMMQEYQVVLSNFAKEKRTLTQFVLRPRIKNFPVGFSNKENIPIVPPGPLAKLIAS